MRVREVEKQLLQTNCFKRTYLVEKAKKQFCEAYSIGCTRQILNMTNNVVDIYSV
jgi:hypothetical protein